MPLDGRTIQFAERVLETWRVRVPIGQAQELESLDWTGLAIVLRDARNGLHGMTAERIS